LAYQLFRQTVISLIELISILLLIRAVFSWFPTVRGGRVLEIIYMITEPVLLPYRTLFNRLAIGRGFPVDLSFLATMITLQIIAAVL